MPREEGKESGVDLVALFAEYCTSASFSSKLDAFTSLHCPSFTGLDLTGDQPLEFTTLHGEYVGIIEEQMEVFCEEKGVGVEELFKEISEAVDDPSLAEFLPQVLNNTEYIHFATQMKWEGEKEHDRDAALEAIDDGKREGVNISGVYRTDIRKPLNQGRMDEFLKVVGCPWFYRKLMIKAAANITDVFITHTEEVMKFKYKMSFFGTREIVYLLDGKRRDVKNLWKVECPQTAWVEDGDDGGGGRVIVRIAPHPALGEDGWSEHAFSVEGDEEGGRVLRWNQRAFNEERGVDLKSDMCFVEVGEGGGRRK